MSWEMHSKEGGLWYYKYRVYSSVRKREVHQGDEVRNGGSGVEGREECRNVVNKDEGSEGESERGMRGMDTFLTIIRSRGCEHAGHRLYT